MEIGMKYKLNRRDVILTALMLAAGGIFYALAVGEQQEQGSEIVITVDGKEFGTYPLNEDREIVIETKKGYNRVIIKDSKAYMEDADCPDRYCVSQGKIQKEKQTVICLPHKLVVEVASGENSTTVEDVDAISG